MRFFIMRHGDAEIRMGPDASRELTLTGQQQTRTVIARRLQELQGVDRIIASPYVRAQQTAQIASELLGVPVETHTQITPDHGVNHLVAVCDSVADQTPLIVTHQPLIGNFIDWLSGLERGRVFMGTSCLAAFDTEVVAAGCGELLWLEQP